MRINPDAPFEAGERFGLEVGRRPFRIGLEIQNDERAGSSWPVWQLRLAPCITPEKRIGQFMHQAPAQLLTLLLVLDVACVGRRRLKDRVETPALGGVGL